MRVDVYRNLKKDCLSIKSMQQPHYGKVVAYMDFVYMKDCKFVVQDSGLDRARETGDRNVHAFVRGEIISPDLLSCDEDGFILIQYDLFDFGGFVDSKGREIKSADHVFIDDKIYVKGGDFVESDN